MRLVTRSVYTATMELSVVGIFTVASTSYHFGGWWVLNIAER